MFTDVVSLDKAAALIGGDKPVSRATIQRMIRDGVLEARGKGQLRRVTVRSIDAYNSGDTAWDGDDPQVRAVPFRTQAASGGLKSRQATADGGALVVLTPRTPSRLERLTCGLGNVYSSSSQHNYVHHSALECGIAPLCSHHWYAGRGLVKATR